MRLYDTTPSLAPAGSASLTSYACKAQHVLPAPVLDACFDAQGHMAYATGLDGSVHAITLADGTRRVLGQKVRLVFLLFFLYVCSSSSVSMSVTVSLCAPSHSH